jgi:hypothetical protein
MNSRFSLGLGALSGVVWILVATFASSPRPVLLAMALMAIIGTALIWKQKATDFKSRFLMGFGSAWTALLVFAGYLVYMRGSAVPVWLHLLNIPITLALALAVGALIAVLSRPWQRPATA